MVGSEGYFPIKNLGKIDERTWQLESDMFCIDVLWRELLKFPDSTLIMRPNALHSNRHMRKEVRVLTALGKLAVALSFGFLLEVFLISGGGLAYPPQFPLQYVHTTPCVVAGLLGICIKEISYNDSFALVDFGLWFAGLSVGVLGLISLLTDHNSIRKRILGMALVGAIAFVIFVPVVPILGSQQTICTGDVFAGQKCQDVTQYGSIAYLLLCSGSIYETSGKYWLAVCAYA